MEDYPTAATFITRDEVRAEMKRLAIAVPLIEERDYIVPNMAPDWWSVGKSTSDPLRGKVLIVPEATKMDQVASVWTGLAKSKCRRRDEPLSPYEYWQRNRDEIVRAVGSLDGQRLDSAIWHKVRGCGAFKPRVAAGVMKLLKARRVLDFSAGWGDRLFAAISTDVLYTGVDPNPNLHGPYKAMIDELVPASKRARYTMIESPFQTAALPEGLTYDLVFTSPPYFDLELYATGVEGSNIDQWKTLFLYPSLNKAWGALELGGHLVLSVNDYRTAEGRVRYVEDMVRYVSTLPGAQSMNTVYHDKCKPYLASSTGGDTTLVGAPLWCWIKLEVEHPSSTSLNPPVVIDQYQLGERRVNVIRDDLLPGSTKQRGALPYLASYSDYDEFVYAGHEGGHGHLCIALVAKTLGKRATLFLSAAGTGNDLVRRSREYGARVYLIPDKLYVVTEEARRYCDRTRGALQVPLGMDNAEYQAQMVRALRESFTLEVQPKRMWIVAGSGRVMRSLQELLPETEFISVRVGREFQDGTEAIYVSGYKLGQEARDEDLPPYPASRTYDAKLWPYVRLHAQDGDYIWNVAGY